MKRLAFLLLPLFSVFFFTSDSSALSSATYIFDDTNNPAVYMDSSTMFPNIDFTIEYLEVVFDAPDNTRNNYMFLALLNRVQTTSYFYLIPDSNGYSHFITSVPGGVFYAQTLSGLPATYTITYTVYDEFPSGSSSEPCPDCPDVPEEIDILRDIKFAIFCIPAMLFMIYVFFIIYRWYA